MQAARASDGGLTTRSEISLRSLATAEIAPGDIEQLEVVVGLVPCDGGAIDDSHLSDVRAILRLDETPRGLVAYVSEPPS